MNIMIGVLLVAAFFIGGSFLYEKHFKYSSYVSSKEINMQHEHFHEDHMKSSIGKAIHQEQKNPPVGVETSLLFDIQGLSS